MRSASPPTAGARFVRITITRPTKPEFEVKPVNAAVGYTHDPEHISPGKPHVRHNIVCEAFGLRPGETLEIRLERIRTRLDESVNTRRLLEGVFPTAGPIAHDGFGWELSAANHTFDSGPAWSPVGRVGAFKIKYSVHLYEGGLRVGGVDPDVNLTPDP